MSRPSEQVLKIDAQVEAQKLAKLSLRSVALLERHEVDVKLFTPRGTDTQSPHDRDEVYIVSSGSGLFRCGEELVEFKAGDLLFVAANIEHRFERFTEDFSTWVIFFGPRSA